MPVSFDLDKLRIILRSCAGEPEEIDLSSEIAAISFNDLGYDSIAMLEAAARVEQEFGVRVDDEVAELRTPKDFVDCVNAKLGEQPVSGLEN
jgi:act minimal PKS acyl carrier protein